MQRLRECKAAGRPVCVMFHAEWCGACGYAKQNLVPQLRQELEAADVELLMVDVDSDQDLASKANVTAMPTFQFWSPSTDAAGRPDLQLKPEDVVVGANLARCQQIAKKFR